MSGVTKDCTNEEEMSPNSLMNHVQDEIACLEVKAEAEVDAEDDAEVEDDDVTFAALPPELLLMVFRHLDNGDLLAACGVCRHWRTHGMSWAAWYGRVLYVSDLQQGLYLDEQHRLEVLEQQQQQEDEPPVQPNGPDEHGLSVQQARLNLSLLRHAPSFSGVMFSPRAWEYARPADVRCSTASLEYGLGTAATFAQAMELVAAQAPRGKLSNLRIVVKFDRPDLAALSRVLPLCRVDVLALDVRGSSDHDAELAADLGPAYLKHLSLRLDGEDEDCPQGRALLLRLLACHAATLEGLVTSASVPAALLRACTRLRRLSCPVVEGLAEALAACPQLELASLTLLGEEAVPATVAFMRQATRLRTLTLTDVSGDGLPFMVGLGAMLDALASTGRSELRSLAIRWVLDDWQHRPKWEHGPPYLAWLQHVAAGPKRLAHLEELRVEVKMQHNSSLDLPFPPPPLSFLRAVAPHLHVLALRCRYECPSAPSPSAPPPPCQLPELRRLLAAHPAFAAKGAVLAACPHAFAAKGAACPHAAAAAPSPAVAAPAE